MDVQLTIDLPDDVVSRLESVAGTQGVRVEELAAEVLTRIAVVGGDFDATLKQTIEEHRQILDRIAET